MSADRAKVIFMGTGPFAAEILRALLREKERFRPVAVFTKASSPAGRGRRRVFSDPVRAAAAENDLPLFSPTGSLRENSVQEQMAGFSPTVAVVASYGKILPPEILSLPERGCVNVHASLLPRWRGASPIQHAIAAGDQKTGVTIMKMDARIDTGAIIAQKELEIGPDETAPELSVRLAELGGRLLTEVLPWYLCGEISPRPQDPSAATVCG
ncbi:MAG TPA: methionyl-tRNA formyltransferase, partial [Candidatus Moranbacteria bacterium]|nr:methionyl-tRNA formyltransferase [Candidatus Moranbacteria bacterium]